jgi:hypothetical protein
MGENCPSASGHIFQVAHKSLGYLGQSDFQQAVLFLLLHMRACTHIRRNSTNGEPRVGIFSRRALVAFQPMASRGSAYSHVEFSLQFNQWRAEDRHIFMWTIRSNSTDGEPRIGIFSRWPRETVFSQLPSAVTSTVDHILGSPSLTWNIRRNPTKGEPRIGIFSCGILNQWGAEDRLFSGDIPLVSYEEYSQALTFCRSAVGTILKH